MAIDVNIVNEGFEFVQNDSIISIILALSTFALVIITLIGLWITNRHAQESNNLMREEIRNKLRPWIKIGLMTPMHFQMKDNQAIPWNPELIFSKKDKIKYVSRMA